MLFGEVKENLKMNYFLRFTLFFKIQFNNGIATIIISPLISKKVTFNKDEDLLNFIKENAVLK